MAPDAVSPPGDAHPVDGTRRPKPVPRYPLKAWHAQFALWLAEQERPSLATMLEAANACANARRAPSLPPVQVTQRALRTLREREDFKGLLAEIESGHLERARARYLSHLDELIGHRIWATRHAVEVGDHRGVGQLTDHVAATLVPPKTGPQFTVDAKTTVIFISERQARGLLAPPIEVTAELLPEEPPPSRQLKPGR